MIKSKFKPKKIEDLVDIFYNDDRKEDKRKYLSHVQTKVLSKACEDEVKKLFSGIGNIKKIPTEIDVRTFDSKIESAKILIETTTLNISNDDDQKEINDKLSKAVCHIGEKNSNKYPNYLRGGVIYYSTVLAFLDKKLTTLIQDTDFIRRLMEKKSLVYLVFVPESASIEGRDSNQVFPSLLYGKDKTIEKKLKKLPIRIKRRIIS